MLRKRLCAGQRNSFAGVVVDMRKILLTLFLALLASAPVSAAFDNSHLQWNELLKQHVKWNAAGTATSVSYAGFAKDRAKLNNYLKALASVSLQEYSKWPLIDQQAFLINAYNAFTVELVLTRYPDLTSIKDIGGVFSSPWKQKFFSLLGEKRSLDDVEHTLLRGDKRYKEPRIHFAVNCASIGCPALRNEAYTSASLSHQLEDQTIRFLNDKTRNRFDLKTGEYSISKIFDWYGKDFERHTGGTSRFLARYADKINLSAAEVSAVKQEKFKLVYRDYDWSLNKK